MGVGINRHEKGLADVSARIDGKILLAACGGLLEDRGENGFPSAACAWAWREGRSVDVVGRPLRQQGPACCDRAGG